MALIISRLGRQRDAEILYASRPKYTALRGALFNLASFSGLDDQTPFATLLQTELPVANGYARVALGAPDSSVFNATLGGWQLIFARSFSAVGLDLNYNAIAILPDAAAVANLLVTAIDTATNRLSITAHGLTNGTPVTLTVDVGGTYPVNANSITGATLIYAKSIDANTIELYTTAALTTIVDFTSAGAGTRRIRNASGDWDLLVTLDIVSTITAGSSKSIQFDPTWLK